jgi:predicted RNA binding protein YcfA (HicA-like mRNA interferase family)
MSPRLKPIPYRKVDRALRALGFLAIRQHGSDVRYEDEEGRAVTIPAHANKDVSRGVIRSLLRYLHLSVDDFERLQ